MTNAINALGHVDCLINCAGISYIGLITDMSDDDWKHIIDSNLSSVFYCCRAVVPSMVNRKQGRILNISSVWGNTGASCEAAYSASKGGMNAFTKALAKELAPSGITVNCIAPGVIDSPMNNAHLSEEEMKELIEQTPLGRLGTAQDVADAAVYLAVAGFVTGQVLGVDGGFY